MTTAQLVLVVRAPNRNTEDFTVRCTPDWTVRMLKRLLSKEYPTKPDSKHQKLIYSGKLLSDNQTLKDVLHQQEGTVAEPQVVHLVCDPCSQRLPPNASTTTTTSTSARQVHDAPHSTVFPQHHVPDMGPSPDIASPSTTSPKQGRTRGKNTDASPQSRTKESAATPPLQGWGRGGGGADHYTLFKHFSRMNQHGFAGQPASPVGDREQTEVEGSIPLLALHPWYAAYMTYCEWILQQRPAEEADGSHGNRAPPVGEDVQENVQAENDVRENFAMNAGPGMVPPEQNNFRQDWLDHFYSVFCFFLLIFIAWSYASVGKFVFFTLILIVILLYQAGFFAVARNRAVRHQQLQEPEELAEPVQEVGRDAPPEGSQEPGDPQEAGEGTDRREEDAEYEDHAQVVNEGTDGGEPVSEEAAPAAPAGGVQVEEQPGVFKTLLIFVVSFFTSLVPQRPPEFVGN